MIAFVKRHAGFLLLLLSVAGLVAMNLVTPVGAQAAVTTLPPTTAMSTMVAVLTVEVRGEVARPGRYHLAGACTVSDLLALAGGALATADLDMLNLDKALYDGMVVAVPALGEPVGAVYVFVDVKGAVRYPGVYRVAATLRVQDAVLLAGGLLAGADTSAVNLAAAVADAMVIAIPYAATQATADAPDPADDDPRIDINTATLEELDTLYGIGYILAQRIIDYRAEHGPFAAIEEIMNVDGIKESVYDRIKEDIRV